MNKTTKLQPEEGQGGTLGTIKDKVGQNGALGTRYN